MQTLIKFFNKEEYALDFYTGTLHMNSFKIFRNIEDQYRNNIRDDNEGVRLKVDKDHASKAKLFVCKEGIDIPIPYSLLSMNFTGNIFCMAITKIVNRNGKIAFELPNQYLNLGTQFVIIHNNKLFRERINIACKKMYSL